METAEIITDAGRAYLKAMGNPQGPHQLACEWVGTHLARWFGLPTFDFAILLLEELDEIPFTRGGFARPGPDQRLYPALKMDMNGAAARKSSKKS